MILETYIVTVRHDGGKTRLSVLSSAGLACVINQVLVAEQCPKSAIINIKRVCQRK